jgi:PBSX family phage terminase large subunit
MGKKYNPNLVHLRKCHREGLSGAILEGSSRSGKSWSAIDFIVFLCVKYDNITINIIRETYNSFKTTLYDDFNRRFPDFGLQSPASGVKDLATFWLFGNRVNFLGADNPAKFEGAGCDYAWFNEMLDIPQTIFDQQEQRCRRFWFGDYNPKSSDHWVYNKVCGRDDVRLLHTTFADNPHISEKERRKILSYEPNARNIEQGTADDYRWAVYGLGKRSSPEGLIFPYVTYIDTFPDDIDQVTYGMDFGYTASPTAICKVGRNGNNLYLEKKVYYPTDDVDLLKEMILGFLPENKHIWADSADPAMISDLRLRGLRVFGVKKYDGSVNHGISVLKRFKIHIVRDRDFQREQENYRYRTINGIKLNQPIDDFNHLWDAARYAVQMEFRL